jgi:hypothetical protein
VKELIARGAPVNATDGERRTLLALAVKACVDSHWTMRRSSGSVQALLDAGASSPTWSSRPAMTKWIRLLSQHAG